MRTPSLNEQFFTACEDGETAEAKKRLDAGADLEYQRDGISGLSMAAHYGKTETVIMLLGCGADKESRSKLGYTPLITAAGTGETQTCLTLLDHGADLEAKENNGHSPLALAARYGLAATCEALLGRNADMEAKNSDDLSPLALAAKYDNPEAILVLIAWGANVASAYTSRHTSLFADYICDCLKYPLHHAAEKGMTKACIRMLDLGYDLDQQDDKAMTPLQHAQAKFPEETASALLAWSARKAAHRIMRDMDGMKP